MYHSHGTYRVISPGKLAYVQEKWNNVDKHNKNNRVDQASLISAHGQP